MNDIQALRENVKDLKVLFVDDEKDVREGTGIFLKKFFNSVTICADGDEGLKTFLQHGDFDIVVTDILMPKIDGVTMAKEIQKIDSKVFIIFLTASRAIKDSEEELSDITLQKPLSFDDMISIMKKLGGK
ncbi:MAG: response regulator [Campylobacterota bacterium]|nr:response regulator [Campylobacterota bacterium]